MTIFGLATAHYAARCVQMAAIHGFADHIADTPRSAAAIAAAMRLDADALDRVLRLLAMHGVFRREAAGYAHTPASELLRSDHPMSLRAFAAMMGDGSNWKSLEVFSHALATGRPAAEKIHPKGIWGWYADHGDEARQFDAAMTSKSQGDIALLIAALDLRGVATVADIGGGRGHFLAAILDANPGVTGVLFDQPEVVANAGDHPRMKKVGGDFFRGALPAADLYLMTHIIHDWADADAIRILTNLRAAAPRGARLVLYELSLPEGAEPHPAKTLDIVMLTITGGRERTPGEYARLFSAAGWTDEGVVRTLGPMALHSARA
jgi:hypothetical protein